MGRLTGKDFYLTACEKCKENDCGNCRSQIKAFEKLAQYEDLQDRLDKQFGGNVSMSMIIDAIIEYDKKSGRDEAIVDAIMLTNENAKEYKEWKELEEQGRLLIVPEIPKNKTLYWIWSDEIMPVIFKRITSCVVDNNGKPHIMCEMVTKKDRKFIQKYRRKPIEYTCKAGDKRYFYSEEIGKTIFFARKEAESVLSELRR